MEVYRAAFVLVELLHEFLNFFLGRFEAQCAQGHLQLLGLNRARATRVEQVESVLNLLLLRLSEVLLALRLLAARGLSCWCCRYLRIQPINYSQ